MTRNSSVELGCSCADTVSIGGIDGNCASCVTGIDLSVDDSDVLCAYTRRGDEWPAFEDSDDCNVK